MKILQLAKNYYPDFGGIESVTYDITEGLNEMNIPCDVLCASNNSRSCEERRKGYNIYRAATFYQAFATSLSFAMITKLRALQANYDLIHVHFPNPMAALALFIVRPKNKLLIHWHSDIVRQRKLHTVFRPLERWVLNRAAIITGTSEAYVQASSPLQDYLFKTTVVPLGIETERLSPDDDLVKRIRASYPGKTIVFSLGRLVYYKGFEYLIKAAKEVDDKTIILIGGGGELHDDLLKLIEEHNLSDKVRLLGRIPDADLGSYYQACDVFCLPSIRRSEAFGVVQLEAMLLGKPIISTDIPGSGVSWVNQHNVTGIIVPPEDASALALAINELANNEEKMKSLGRGAKERFFSQFTRKHMVDRYIAIYSKVSGKSI